VLDSIVMIAQSAGGKLIYIAHFGQRPKAPGLRKTERPETEVFWGLLPM
jgi:hypothetical protein